METIETVFVVVLIGFMIFHLINFYNKKGDLSSDHKYFVKEISPHREISSGESQRFKKVYKKEFPSGGQVFKISGPVDYISLSEDDEDVFTLGKVMLSTKATKKIRKKMGFDLTELIPDLSENQKVKDELDNLGKKAVDGVMDEEEVERKINRILGPYRDHEMEFVFPDGKDNPAFPLYIGSQKYV